MSNLLLEQAHHKVLSKEVELELIRKAQNGDNLSMQKLLEHNVKWIMKLAIRFRVLHKFPDRKDDILQEGMIGLITAIKKFDITSDLKLSTYSQHWIRNAITRPVYRGDYLDFQQHSVGHGRMSSDIFRFGKSDNGLMGKEMLWCRILEHHTSLDGKTPGYITISQFNSSYDAILSGGIISTDAITLNNGDEGTDMTSFIDTVEENALSGDQSLQIDESMKKLLMEYVSKLKPKLQETIIHRFGINTEPKTLECIANMNGITRERIRQREVEALKLIKNRMDADNLSFMDFIA